MEAHTYYCCCVTSLPRSLLLGSHLLILCAWGGGGGGLREWVNNQVLLTLELSQTYNQLLARDCDYFMIGLGTDPKKETIVFVTWHEKKIFHCFCYIQRASKQLTLTSEVKSMTHQTRLLKGP